MRKRRFSIRSTALWLIFVLSFLGITYGFLAMFNASDRARTHRWDGGYRGTIARVSDHSWEAAVTSGDSTVNQTFRLAQVIYKNHEGATASASILVDNSAKTGAKIHFWQDANGNISTAEGGNGGHWLNVFLALGLGFLIGALIGLLSWGLMPSNYWWSSSRRWWNRIQPKSEQTA